MTELIKKELPKFHLLSLYSIVHFLVDYATIFLLVTYLMPQLSQKKEWIFIVILYNFCAFALQMPLGILLDRLNKNGLMAAIGCLLVIIGYMCLNVPVLAIIFAGLGNALFHLGAGIDVLNISKKKTSYIGIFISTGALGLLCANRMHLNSWNNKYGIISVMVIAGLCLIALYKKCKKTYLISNNSPSSIKMQTGMLLIALSMFFVVLIRSYVGSTLHYSWQIGIWSIYCVIGVFFGKCVGGILADKYGKTLIGVGSLFIAGIFFAFGKSFPLLGVFGLFFFNMTMPITLSILSNVFKNGKGLAFGMLTLGIFLGNGISVMLEHGPFGEFVYLLALVFVSTILLAYGIISDRNKGVSE